MITDDAKWENYYQSTPVSELPWNAGGPDPDLVRLVTTGQIQKGQALDIGVGLGHDAVFLIKHGFDVIGIDVSPTAIRLARENASASGLFGFFQPGDIRHIPVEDGFIDFANDRGCFHILNDDDRLQAVNEIHRVLHRRSLFLLRVFSDRETTYKPPIDTTAGDPHRFTRPELESLFAKRFRILEFWDGEFAGPAKPKSYSMLMEKR